MTPDVYRLVLDQPIQSVMPKGVEHLKSIAVFCATRYSRYNP